LTDRVRNLILVLFLLIPLVSANFGYNEIVAIMARWKTVEQERFANQKLGEIAIQNDISQQISSYCAAFKDKLTDLLLHYTGKNLDNLPLSDLAANSFQPPFPDYDIWIFSQPATNKPGTLVFTTAGSASRRPLEMIYDHLIAETNSISQKDHESRRNEKMLQKIFGRSSIGKVIANYQRGIATPVIYQQTPSYLVWDFASREDGKAFGYFLVVKRNQNLEKCGFTLAAEKTGFGRDYAGGFVSIFSESDDHYFPERIRKSEIWQNWRRNLGSVIQNLKEWENNGLPWGMRLGKHKLYTRILRNDGHIAFILLPDLSLADLPGWLKALNYLMAALIVLLLLRGLLLNTWPFANIGSRFVVAFLLATTLPVALFVTSATAYVYERYNADENQIKEELTNCLLNFDAGKEYLENSYLKAFSQLMSDQEIKTLLGDNGLAASGEVFARINEITSASGSYRVPLSGIALYDMTGRAKFHTQGTIIADDFVSIANFYGLSFTTNLRAFAEKYEPDIHLPDQIKNEKYLAAMQSFRRSNESLEYEIERFRNRVIKTIAGRGHLEYIYDFVSIEGKYRFALMLAWLDTDINEIVLEQNALKLGVNSPHIQIAGFRRTAAGIESILATDRSISRQQQLQYAQIAKSAFSIKSGMTSSLLDGRSVVAYASRNFENTILIAATDHDKKNLAHILRLLSFAGLGIFGLTILIFSGLTTYMRVVRPLKKVKQSLDQMDAGYFPQIAASERKDEIGLLYQEFSAMVKGLEERQRLASMLSGQALSALSASSEGTMLRSEVFEGVVLISDIRDFTTMCEKYEPKQVTRLLNIHFAEMAAVITGYGGKIYKFIGDAIEAVFVDEPGNNQPPALRASLAAAAMLLRLQQINNRRQSDGRFSYRIGVGLAAGRLIAGEVGSKSSRLDYAMFGDAFKMAEKLEAFTKKFPEYPLMVEQGITAQTPADLFNWKEESLEDKAVYRLTGFSEKLVEQINTREASLFHPEKVADKTQSAGNKQQSWFDQNIALCRKLVYAVGTVCILFPAVAGILTIFTTIRATADRENRAMTEHCESVRTKLQVADLSQVLLEQYLDDSIENAAKLLSWNKSGTDRESVQALAESLTQKFDADGLPQTVFSVLHKPGGNQNFKPDSSWQLVKHRGKPEYEESYAELLRMLTESALIRGWPPMDSLKEKLPMLLGSSMVLTNIFYDMHARVIPVKISGSDEYFYWQPILMRNHEKLAQLEKIPRFDLRDPPAGDFIVNIGAIMVLISRETIKNSPLAILKNLLNRESIDYAVIAENGSMVAATSLFAGHKLSFEGTPPSIADWHIVSSHANLGNSKYRVYIGQKKPASRIGWPAILSCLLISATTLTVLRAWKRAIYLERGVTTRFAWQLWLGLFTAAIVPLTCVYSVNELFAIGQKEMRPVEERLRLFEHSERLEQRQFLQERVNWHSLAQITRSAELKSAIDNAGSMTTDEQKTDFNSKVTQILTDSAKRQATRYNDMLIFSHQGWQHSYTPPDGGDVDKNEFKRFLDFFVKNLFIELGMGKESGREANQSLGAEVKAEITRDSGLEVFRNLFGSDAYFSLVHGLNLPITIFMASGHGYLSLMAAPDLVKPETMVFWLFFDNLNSSIQKMFVRLESVYPIFTESTTRYGALKLPNEGSCEPLAAYFARWATAAKMPISERAVYAGQQCLAEARLSRQNESMMLVGFIPERSYLDQIESVRRQFLSMLLLSILAIILLTLFVSNDIIGPIIALTHGVKKIAARQLEYRIQDSRKDELGQMQNTFNTIARSLQEKELMGQMVSSAAKKIARDAKSLREAESGLHLNVSVLYLAVPQFALFMQTMNHQELIAEVRSHIDTICRIIIANGGEADKIMGEKVLAWFYSPDGREASAMMAARAMHALRDAERAGELKFPITAGVHNGEIIAGLLGFGSQRDFTIIGDPVNTAARICSRAAELPSERFLGSEAFVGSLAAGSARFYDFGKVELKGKAETISLKQIIF